MFTKTAWSVGSLGRVIPGWAWKADVAGVGPVSTAINTAEVASGNASVGEALAGSSAGGASFLGLQRAMRAPAGKVTSALSRFVPKATSAATRGQRFMSKLPGRMGTVASFGTAMLGSGVIGNKARRVAKKHAPIWKRETLAKPLQELTPEQRDLLNKYTFRS
jgi:hypothetical protein